MQAFSEFVTSPARAPTRTGTPGVGSAAKPGRYTAKVSHADRMNANGRVYPRHVLEAEINRLKPLLAQGRLAGALDHVDYDASGNMRDEALLWRNLRLEADGSVVGEFELMNTARGRDLKEMLKSGRQIGLSTFGFGVTRPPTAAERRRYGIAADDDEAGVMEPGFRLTAIDAVSDPSCFDAYLYRESRERPHREKAPEPKLTGIAAEVAALIACTGKPQHAETGADRARARMATMAVSERDPRVIEMVEAALKKWLTAHLSMSAEAVDQFIAEKLAEYAAVVESVREHEAGKRASVLWCVAG